MINIFCKIDGQNIPLVSTGTSPFFGAAQFGRNARVWRKKFLNDKDAVLEILKAAYEAGARGIEVVPGGKVLDAAREMTEAHSDYIITGSTFPGPDPMINEMIDCDAKLIFVHGMVSDGKDKKLIDLLDEISSRGVIPGIAAHSPITVINWAVENSVNVKAFLIPFNANGLFMDNQKELEVLVNKTKSYTFVGMKTLAAGALKPKPAYEYISQHNISAVAIGMVDVEEAKEAVSIALEALK